MRSILLLLFLLPLSTLLAQDHPSCDGQRYWTEVFDEVKVTSTLQYGEGTTIGGNTKELYLDVYEPVGDDAEMRPVIILAFGGSFIMGNRGDMAWMCERFAKRGFVAVTIDYRLYDLSLVPLPTEEEMIDVVTKAVSDMKASIRYMREDAATDNLFKIDPDLVFVGGISAGAIAACHTAVMDSTDTYTDQILSYINDNGGFDGDSSDNYQYSSEVQGFVSLSGGLHNADWIDAGDPPFVSVHDDGDDIVPYGGDYASIFGVNIIYMDGSQILHEKADALGIENALRTIENSNVHVSYLGSSQSINAIMDFTSGFLHNIICGDSPLHAIPTDHPLAAIEVFPNPTSGFIYLKNENHLPLQLRLFNGLGQKIGTWKNQNQLDLSDLQTGIYFLQIENMENQLSVVKKIRIEK